MDFRGPSENIELKFPSGGGYFDQSYLIRLLVGLGVCFILFLFINSKDVPVDSLRLNTVAKEFIVSQVDFPFLDQETTNMLRQDAIREVGLIWRFTEREIRNKKYELEKTLTQTDTIRDRFPGISLTEWFIGIELFQEKMADLRFTDPRTLKLLQNESMDTPDFLIFTPKSGEAEITFPKTIWQTIEQKAFDGTSLPKEMGGVLVHFYENASWKLVEDVSLVRDLSKNIQKGIADHYRMVTAGERVIDRGERVLPRHLAMLESMKEVMSEHRNIFHPSTFLGSLILALLFTFLLAYFLYQIYPKTFFSNRRLILLFFVTMLTLIATKGVGSFLSDLNLSISDGFRYPILIPLASIIVAHLFEVGMAVFITGFLTIFLGVVGILTPMGMILNITASVVAIVETRHLRYRKDVFVISAKAWLVMCWVVLGAHFYNRTFGEMIMLSDIISSLIFMMVTAILVIGLIPLFETAFSIITDVTLMEYMNPTNNLLRRLSVEAPGTYQHSLVVGSISEAAALSIGANGLFCRVSTLYHDIGKLDSPQYYTENQQANIDIHQLLSPQESAEVIRSHVTKGLAMAKEAKLPQQFMDIISQHHGTTLVYYFYCEFLKQVGGDASKIDENEFRYFGPTPRSKESAIIMIADSFEAASRSLDEASEENLMGLMDKIVEVKTQDRQLDECNLTFYELAKVKSVMVQTLLAIYHSRIKYPKKEDILKSET